MVKIGEGVEWAVHCCTILALLPDGAAMPASRLAEYHGVPAAYLAKHLQALSRSGIVETAPGARGGYRLARSADDVTVLDIVEAVEGAETAFRCTEIRQRGPAAVEGAAYLRPCGVARTMWRAEYALRRELAATSVADLCAGVMAVAPPEGVAKAATWFKEVLR
jgi:Rrf2 family protein